MSSVEARLARNELMFRAINERIRELAARFEDDEHGPVSFLCECADETCVERLSMTYGDKPVELRRGLYSTASHYYRNELS